MKLESLKKQLYKSIEENGIGHKKTLKISEKVDKIVLTQQILLNNNCFK